MSDLTTIVVTRGPDDRPARAFAPRYRLVNVRGEARSIDQTRCAIGSHATNDVCVDDPAVSRFHCAIVLDDEGLRVVDEGSRNGTFVDGVRTREAWLVDGSRLTVGTEHLTLRVGDERFEVPLYPEDSYGELVGRSVAMRGVFARLDRCAAADATVLIEGETGTGKEATAEAIHAHSARSDKPFIVVDAASLQANLLESELFGHVKGAFTGAVDDRVGAFEAAEGGTVFLDEIGELPADLQPKLLRVLERRTIRRVGENKSRSVDVRIIAATHRNLREATNTGVFRSDLYFRLAVVPVRMPPLRDRPEDLEPLVERILNVLGADEAARHRIMNAGFFERLRRAQWPGNVRELRNYIERAMVLDIPVEEAAIPRPVDPRVSYSEARRHALDRFEREYLVALLEHCRGNISDAARGADMNRAYMYRLLRKHHLR